MTLPQVTITELDGALGVLPPSAGRLTVFLGCCSAGPFNTPATFARTQDLQANFDRGPNVEAAAFYIVNTGRPVVFIRAAVGSTAPSVGAVTMVGTGTSVITVSPDVGEPADDYQYRLRVVNGGTVGTAGITVQGSRDGGYTWTPVVPLGTLTEITTVTGVTFHIGPGTMVAGDVYSAEGTGPVYDSTTLLAALNALAVSSIAWEQLVLTGPIIGSLVATIDTAINGLRAHGRYRSWIGCYRMPNAGESESAYQLAFNASFGSATSIVGGVTAGATRLVSVLDGRLPRRPLLFGFMALQGNVSEEINVADVNLGPIPGAFISDGNGNPLEHDESLNPGLDDNRAITARSWDGYPGVYVTRPRLLSGPTSDFQIIPYRRVMNLAEDALRMYFIRRLNRPVRVDTSTGFILEADAVEIEAGATETLRAALLAKPKASGVQFVLSRVDNVLATKTLTGRARVIPLAYPEFIEIEVGFYNPALATPAAA
jgi:hypothetical protein